MFQIFKLNFLKNYKTPILNSQINPLLTSSGLRRATTYMHPTIQKTHANLFVALNPNENAYCNASPLSDSASIPRSRPSIGQGWQVNKRESLMNSKNLKFILMGILKPSKLMNQRFVPKKTLTKNIQLQERIRWMRKKDKIHDQINLSWFTRI